MNYNINQVSGRMANSGNNNPSPIAFNMGKGVLGSYDNLKLKTGCADSWRKPPCNPPIKSDRLFVPQGTPLPLKNEMIYSEIPEDSMFLFARSVSDPSCCPSTFSTDRGCVCTTPQQRKYVAERRGGNKSYGNYSF